MDSLVLKNLVGSLSAIDCLSPAECHDAAHGLLGPNEREAIRAHADHCADCRVRLVQAEQDAQQTLQANLAVLDAPADESHSPASFLQLLEAGLATPGPGSEVWQAWQGFVKVRVRLVSPSADDVPVAARGVVAACGEVESSEGAVTLECDGAKLTVSIAAIPGADSEIRVQVLDQLQRPAIGQRVELLAEGDALPQVEHTSVRGRVVFWRQLPARAILRLGVEAIGLEIDRGGGIG